MDTNPLPNAEKKRTKNNECSNPTKGVLLKPTTWKAAIAALDFVLKLVRVGAKIWEMFQ